MDAPFSPDEVVGTSLRYACPLLYALIPVPCAKKGMRAVGDEGRFT
ncbi:MAG: hypothetical protein V1775_09985 [Bacteroidota bacterium]